MKGYVSLKNGWGNKGKDGRVYRIKKVVRAGGMADGPIRLQLDARTVITVNSTKAVAFWKTRYSNLKQL